MAAISTNRKIDPASVAQSGTFTDVFDVTCMKNVSVQITKTGTGKGTAKLQWSNDGTNWKDVNTTLNPDATGAVAAGASTTSLYADGFPGSLARITFTEDGTGTVSITGGKWIAKMH